jgi:ammonia channel protein AmtB
MKKKKGDMTIRTIVAIALAVVVLIFLIYGFSVGWGNLWGRISNFIGGDNNVNTIQQTCDLKCLEKNKYEFCTKERTIKTGTATYISTCFKLPQGENAQTQSLEPIAGAEKIPCPGLTC